MSCAGMLLGAAYFEVRIKSIALTNKGTDEYLS